MTQLKSLSKFQQVSYRSSHISHDMLLSMSNLLDRDDDDDRQLRVDESNAEHMRQLVRRDRRVGRDERHEFRRLSL